MACHMAARTVQRATAAATAHARLASGRAAAEAAIEEAASASAPSGRWALRTLGALAALALASPLLVAAHGRRQHGALRRQVHEAGSSDGSAGDGESSGAARSATLLRALRAVRLGLRVEQAVLVLVESTGLLPLRRYVDSGAAIAARSLDAELLGVAPSVAAALADGGAGEAVTGLQHALAAALGGSIDQVGRLYAVVRGTMRGRAREAECGYATAALRRCGYFRRQAIALDWLSAVDPLVAADAGAALLGSALQQSPDAVASDAWRQAAAGALGPGTHVAQIPLDQLLHAVISPTLRQLAANAALRTLQHGTVPAAAGAPALAMLDVAGEALEVLALRYAVAGAQGAPETSSKGSALVAAGSEGLSRPLSMDYGGTPSHSGRVTFYVEEVSSQPPVATGESRSNISAPAPSTGWMAWLASWWSPSASAKHAAAVKTGVEAERGSHPWRAARWCTTMNGADDFAVAAPSDGASPLYRVTVQTNVRAAGLSILRRITIPGVQADASAEDAWLRDMHPLMRESHLLWPAPFLIDTPADVADAIAAGDTMSDGEAGPALQAVAVIIGARDRALTPQQHAVLTAMRRAFTRDQATVRRILEAPLTTPTPTPTAPTAPVWDDEACDEVAAATLMLHTLPQALLQAAAAAGYDCDVPSWWRSVTKSEGNAVDAALWGTRLTQELHAGAAAVAGPLAASGVMPPSSRPPLLHGPRNGSTDIALATDLAHGISAVMEGAVPAAVERLIARHGSPACAAMPPPQWAGAVLDELLVAAVAWADGSTRPRARGGGGATPTAVITAMLTRGQVLAQDERPWPALLRFAWPLLLRHTLTVLPAGADASTMQAQLTGDGAALVYAAVSAAAAIVAAAAAAQPR